jgi:hypothetical protein
MPTPYQYTVRHVSTAYTTAKVFVQIKTGLAPIEIIEIRLGQLSKTSTEFWNLLLSRWTAAATAGAVTSTTPGLVGVSDPASLAVGGASATGINGAVPTGGSEIVELDTSWNIVNGEWVWPPVPEGRSLWIPQGGALFTLRNLTAPAASTNVVGTITYREYQ